jgi:Fe-Mn family superoxide dismutase
MDRRNFLFVSSGAAAGSVIVPGLSAADEGSPDDHSGLVTGMLKPLPYQELPGFLSVEQIGIHHKAHYGGALRAFVGVEKRFEQALNGSEPVESAAFQRMKQLQSSRGNSVVLHERYFDGLTSKPVDPGVGIRTAIERRFGSMDKWASDFTNTAKAATGWAMLVVHPINGKLYNVMSDEHAQGPLWLSVPLVVIDTYEHAFYVDYKNRKGDYISKFLEFIDWGEADRRLDEL